MRPFLAIRRQELIDLPVPWDPAKVLEEYLEDPAKRQEIALSDAQLATLVKDGVVVRIDGRHRWIGAMQGEMRIVVLDPTTVELNIDGWATLRWFLRPFALPFRGRARRAVEAQIDRLIAELESDIKEVAQDVEAASAKEVTEDDEAASVEPVPDGSRAPAADGPGRSGGFSWTVRVLTVGGDLIYERVEGTRPPV